MRIRKRRVSTTAPPRTTTSASSFFTTGKTDRAQLEYRKALAGDASLPLAYLHLGTIAFKAAKYDDAIKLLRDGMPHFDADSKRIALKMLGRAQLIRGDRAGGRASLEEALKLDANDAESLLLLGRIARHEQRLDDAKSLLQRAPRNNIVMLERALVARDAGDLAAERAALEALPDRPALRAELAVVNAAPESERRQPARVACRRHPRSPRCSMRSMENAKPRRSRSRRAPRRSRAAMRASFSGSSGC